MLVAIKLCTTNDTNGNPRRGWMVVESSGDQWTHTVGWVEEGYEGRAALTRSRFGGAAEGPALTVAPAEFKRQRKHAVAAELELAGVSA